LFFYSFLFLFFCALWWYIHCGSLELDLLMASVGASEDHVSVLRAEGDLAVLEQAISVGGDDSGEEVEG
jgi:hypothetical protein